VKLLGSLTFCILVIAIFCGVAAASRRNLPAGLLELYGDISGISALTIEGEVFSWEGRYAYSFTIAPGRQRTRMRVINNSQTFNGFHQRRFLDLHARWSTSILRLAYLPIDDTQPVATYSVYSFFTDHTGNHMPMPEYRIYSEVFAVKPLFLFSYPLHTPTYEHQLFRYVGPGAYISTWRNGFDRYLRWADWHIVHKVFPIPASFLHFFDTIHIGDSYFVVPIGQGLFGNTAVYTVYMPGNLVPTVGCLYNNMVEASVLFPITIERGKDEIIGLLEWDESVLLFISRVNGLEVTRINPANGENRTIFVETNARFEQHYLCDNYLILQGRNHHGTIIATFDLQNDDINVVNIFPIRHPDIVTFTDIHDIIFYSGIVYIAHSIDLNPWSYLHPATRKHISAFNNDGQLIGHAQILSGVEDDNFWMLVGGGWAQRYRRELQSLTLRGPY